MKPFVSALVLAVAVVSHTGFAASKTMVCLTGSMPKAIPNYGTAFINGSKLALSELKAEDDIELETHFYDHGPLDGRTTMDAMLRSGCHAILGFDFTGDLMLVRQQSEQHDLLVLSLYGMMNETLRSTRTIRSMQAPTIQLISPLLTYADKRLGRAKKSLIVTAVDVGELRDFRDATLKFLDASGRAAVTVNVLETSFKIDDVAPLIAEAAGGFDTIFLFLKTRQSAELADWIASTIPESKQPALLGTKFFGTQALPVFVNMLKHKKTVAYHTHQSSHADPDPAYAAFVRSYTDAFKAPPMGISLLAHDATAFVVRALNQMATRNTMRDADAIRQNLLKAAEMTSSEGASGVRFMPGLKLFYDKVFVVRTDESGYSLAK